MKLLRISASLLAFSAFTVLAACGGGGGGSTPPTTGGGAPPPTSSSPSPSPGSSATPTPTSSPSGSIGTSSTVETAYDTVVNGTDNWQTTGATTSDPGDGDTATGANGTNTVDGISCALGSESAVTSTSYHVHAFLGIMVNGTQYAIPDAIGMNQPTSDEPITNFQCAYNIHTHGASGIIHVEDPTMSENYSATPAQYNLQALFDIWGQSLSGLSITGVTGMPAIYVGTPSSKDSKGNDLVNSYSPYAGSPTDLLLTHHTAIWLVYGTPPSAGLPQVDFQISS